MICCIFSKKVPHHLVQLASQWVTLPKDLIVSPLYYYLENPSR